MINFIFDYSDVKLSAIEEESLKEAAQKAFAAEGVDFDFEISVVITDNEGIREINRDYRNIDKETDVLSFPQYDFVNPTVFAQDPTDSQGEIMLGDIVISKEKVSSQAEEIGHSFERELQYLTVHSCLHLLGYDHISEEDKKIMRAREKQIMGDE